jgi:hypothetical protein
MTIRQRTKERVIVLAAFVASVGCSPTTPVAGPRTGGGSGDPAARAKGAQDAKDVIAAGVLKIKEYPPLPSPAWQGDYIRLLKDRCGVDYEVPALPAGVSEADFIEEIRGWNDVMRAEIRKRFGERVLEDLQEEARPRKWRKGKLIIG